MIHQIVPANPPIAPSILLNRHVAIASAALTPDADLGSRPDLDDIGVASTAMAWAMQGRLRMVRGTLRHLSPVMRHAVAEVAWQLSVVAASMSTFDETQELPILPNTPAHSSGVPSSECPICIPSGVEGYPIGGEGR